TGTGTLAVTGGGTLSLTGTNSYAGGTSITGGSTVAVTADANLGAASAVVLLGDAASAGTLRFVTGGLFTSTRGFVLGNLGSARDTQGTASVTLSGPIVGAG